MWFKSLQIFKFIENFIETEEAILPLLEAQRFMPCRTVDVSTQGFVPPNGDKEGPLVYAANGFFLFCLQREDKIIPSTVVKQMLDEKVLEIETAQGRKVRKREKENLKEDILHQLTLRAFSKISKTYAYIDTIDGYLVVNASNHAKAEEFSIALRSALGSLKIEVPKVQSVTTLLTHWLKTNEYPADFTVNDQCILSDPKDKGSIRCQRQNLFAEDIQNLLHEGRMVAELSMSWSEQVSFSLKEDFSVKSLKYLELVQDQSRDVVAETTAARFDADFTIMAGTLRNLIRGLFEAFGAKA
jgi:recombination associated protein RdgC